MREKQKLFPSGVEGFLISSFPSQFSKLFLGREGVWKLSHLGKLRIGCGYWDNVIVR